MVKMRGLGVGLAAVRRAEAEADERDEASEKDSCRLVSIGVRLFPPSETTKGWATLC